MTEKPLRIAHVIPSFAPGGMSTFVYQLAIEQAKSGNDIVIICTDQYDEGFSFSDPMRENYILETLHRYQIPVRKLGRKLGSGFWGACRLLPTLRKVISDCDIIHTHLPVQRKIVGMLQFAKPNMHHVTTIHNCNIPIEELISRWVPKGTLYVFCSYAALSDAVSRIGDRHLRCCAVPNGITVDEETNRKEDNLYIKKSLGIPIDGRVVVSIGRMTEQKNQSCAISAFNRFFKLCRDEQIYYVLCGVGSLKGVLERQIDSLDSKENIRLVGTRNDIPDILRAAHCFLSTSLWEGLPITVLEALFAGTVCTLSPIMPHQEVGGGMPGCFLATENTPEGIARVLIQAVEFATGHSHAQLRKERELLLETYTMQHCQKEYRKKYEELLKH